MKITTVIRILLTILLLYKIYIETGWATSLSIGVLILYGQISAEILKKLTKR